MKRTIEVTVSPIGDILIDAIGFKGADCEKATRFLEEALGVVGSPHFFVAGDDFFCPALDITHDDGGLSIAFDADGFDKFLAAALG